MKTIKNFRSVSAAIVALFAVMVLSISFTSCDTQWQEIEGEIPSPTPRDSTVITHIITTVDQDTIVYNSDTIIGKCFPADGSSEIITGVRLDTYAKAYANKAVVITKLFNIGAFAADSTTVNGKTIIACKYNDVTVFNEYTLKTATLDLCEEKEVVSGYNNWASENYSINQVNDSTINGVVYVGFDVTFAFRNTFVVKGFDARPAVVVRWYSEKSTYIPEKEIKKIEENYAYQLCKEDSILYNFTHKFADETSEEFSTKIFSHTNVSTTNVDLGKFYRTNNLFGTPQITLGSENFLKSYLLNNGMIAIETSSKEASISFASAPSFSISSEYISKGTYSRGNKSTSMSTFGLESVNVLVDTAKTSTQVVENSIKYNVTAVTFTVIANFGECQKELVLNGQSYVEVVEGKKITEIKELSANYICAEDSVQHNLQVVYSDGSKRNISFKRYSEISLSGKTNGEFVRNDNLFGTPNITMGTGKANGTKSIDNVLGGSVVLNLSKAQNVINFNKPAYMYDVEYPSAATLKVGDVEVNLSVFTPSNAVSTADTAKVNSEITQGGKTYTATEVSFINEVTFGSCVKELILDGTSLIEKISVAPIVKRFDRNHKLVEVTENAYKMSFDWVTEENGVEKSVETIDATMSWSVLIPSVPATLVTDFAISQLTADGGNWSNNSRVFTTKSDKANFPFQINVETKSWTPSTGEVAVNFKSLADFIGISDLGLSNLIDMSDENDFERKSYTSTISVNVSEASFSKNFEASHILKKEKPIITDIKEGGRHGASIARNNNDNSFHKIVVIEYKQGLKLFVDGKLTRSAEFEKEVRRPTGKVSATIKKGTNEWIFTTFIKLGDDSYDYASMMVGDGTQVVANVNPNQAQLKGFTEGKIDIDDTVGAIAKDGTMKVTYTYVFQSKDVTEAVTAPAKW